MTESQPKKPGRKPSTRTLEHLARTSLVAMLVDDLHVIAGLRKRCGKKKPWSRPLKSFLAEAAAETTLHGEKPEGVTVRWAERARAQFHERMVQEIVAELCTRLARADTPA